MINALRKPGFWPYGIIYIIVIFVTGLLFKPQTKAAEHA
jgi:hypothetical protein